MTLMLVENMPYERACKALTDSGYEISSVQTFHDGVGARYTFTIKKDGKEVTVTDTSNKAALEAAYHAIESEEAPTPVLPAEPAPAEPAAPTVEVPEVPVAAPEEQESAETPEEPAEKE